VAQWLTEHQDQIEVFWLPSYCPSLNLIERLWGHMKRTVLANVLYETIADLIAAFRKGMQRIMQVNRHDEGRCFAGQRNKLCHGVDLLTAWP
jgi:hypothetical protein